MRYLQPLPALLLLISCAPRPDYDLIIRGGTVYDGTGTPGRIVDIAISGDTIAAIGDLAGKRARQDVDASGLAVTPGFINMLSWAVSDLLVDGRSQGDIRQGVTLEIFGEGNSMEPLTDSMRTLMLAEQGDLGAAFALEQLWNALGSEMPFTMMCGYCSAHFTASTAQRSLRDICGTHTDVMADADDTLGRYLLATT